MSMKTLVISRAKPLTFKSYNASNVSITFRGIELTGFADGGDAFMEVVDNYVPRKSSPLPTSGKVTLTHFSSPSPILEAEFEDWDTIALDLEPAK